MSVQTVEVTRGRIARVMLNRPEKRNALDAQMLDELRQALLSLNQDPDCVVIILCGKGAGFCAGADLGDVMKPRSALENRAAKRGVMELLMTMGKIDKVIIAQVHGFALAGGFGVAAAADLTVVTNDCRLGMPEIQRGLGPMNIMKPLSRCMPRKILLELILTGERISPAQALEWGIVNRVVPSDQLERETMALAESIAGHSGAAVSLCKNAFYNMQDMELETAYRYLTEMLTINASTEDANEGVQAFFEKRPPVWTDR